MISLDLNLKNKVIKQQLKLKRKLQNNNKIAHKKRHRIKIKITNKKLKSLNLQLKKILKKTKKAKTNQIIIVYKKEVFKNQIKIKKLNTINIQVPILKAQNHYKFILIGNLIINLELKEFLKILKNRKEKKISKIIFKITSNKNKAHYQNEALNKTKIDFLLNLINLKIIQSNFVPRNK